MPSSFENRPRSRGVGSSWYGLASAGGNEGPTTGDWVDGPLPGPCYGHGACPGRPSSHAQKALGWVTSVIQRVGLQLSIESTRPDPVNSPPAVNFPPVLIRLGCVLATLAWTVHCWAKTLEETILLLLLPPMSAPPS